MYLSKEDRQPVLYNVRVSELSLFARAWHHAKTTYRDIRPIQKSDPFIVGLGQHSRFAISIVEEHLAELRRFKAMQRVVYEPNRVCKVSRDILGVLNESMSHLYIQGAPGYGKTEIVDWFLKGKSYWKAGEPSSFLFGTLPDKVDYIWFEDFDMHKYGPHLSTLLSLMDHKETTVSRKCCDDRTVVLNARFIFISNYFIPSEYPMFARRVKYMEIEHKLHECVGCGPAEEQAVALLDIIQEQTARLQNTLRRMEHEEEERDRIENECIFPL